MISDSLPIKFWATSETTFNDTVKCGVFSDCFCSPLKYNGEIILQFNYPSALTLKMYDDSDNLLNQEDFTLIADGDQQISFYPNVFALTEYIKRVYFKVFSGGQELYRSDCCIIGGCIEYPASDQSPIVEYWSWESGAVLKWESEIYVTL